MVAPEPIYENLPDTFDKFMEIVNGIEEEIETKDPSWRVIVIIPDKE